MTTRDGVIDVFSDYLEDSSVFNADDMREYFKSNFPDEEILTDEEIDYIQTYKVYVCDHCCNTRLLHNIEVITEDGSMFCNNSCYEDATN